MGVWAFTPASFSVLFGGVDRGYLRLMMKRFADNGVLQRAARGVYVNPTARSLPDDIRLGLIPFLRPRELSYVSYESRLSELGVISQISNALTCATTGSSGNFNTPWGRIEFTKTSREMSEQLEDELVWRDRSPIPFATTARAIKDLKRSGRSLDLVDEETLEDVLAEENEVSNAFHP